MISVWLVFPTGIFIAMVSSIVGIGGGILWMPFLLLILNLTPEVAVLTSLIIQIFGMGSGSIACIRQGRVDLKLALIILLATAPGIIVGVFITRVVSFGNIKLMLGVLAMTTAFLFVSSNQKQDNRGRFRAKTKRISPYMMLFSLLSVVSGMLSVSIGEWLIPIMNSKMNLRMTTAIATSITSICGVCFIGAVFHLLIGGSPSWPVVVWAVPGVIIGGQIGPLITERINERILKEMFIFLLTILGIHLIYNSF